jgi:hypothetical protein
MRSSDIGLRVFWPKTKFWRRNVLVCRKGGWLERMNTEDAYRGRTKSRKEIESEDAQNMTSAENEWRMDREDAWRGWIVWIEKRDGKIDELLCHNDE